MGFRSPCNNTTRAIQAPKCGICVSGPVLHTGQITCKTEPPASRSLQQGRACGMGWPITRQSAKGSNPQKSAVGFRGGVRVRESISGEVVISRKTSLSNHSPGWKTTCVGGITQKADCKDAAARCSYDKVAEMATSPRGRRETFTPFQLAIPSLPPHHRGCSHLSFRGHHGTPGGGLWGWFIHASLFWLVCMSLIPTSGAEEVESQVSGKPSLPKSSSHGWKRDGSLIYILDPQDRCCRGQTEREGRED